MTKTIAAAACYALIASALANCWKAKFGGNDVNFIYTIPSKTLAPKITAPRSIKGKSYGVEINAWTDTETLIDFVEGLTR